MVTWFVEISGAPNHSNWHEQEAIPSSL